MDARTVLEQQVFAVFPTSHDAVRSVEGTIQNMQIQATHDQVNDVANDAKPSLPTDGRMKYTVRFKKGS